MAGRPSTRTAARLEAKPADVVVVARALADSNRLRIFLALRHSERCVSDVAASVDLPQPLVSHHLGVLTTAGLLQVRRHSGFRMYAVSPHGMAAAQRLLSELLDPDAVPEQARPGGNATCCR